jgi:Tol biopolymer transport system component
MGQVYRARDERLDRSVAIKVLAPALSADAQFRARFQREARVLASLNHPNIAAVYEFDEVDGRHLLVMELVEGETLADRLKKGKLSFEDTVRNGAQIADALAAAHTRGITHRDLKPGNIMIAKSVAKVLDFGLAKSVDDSLTASRVVMGTPAYMAPEQREGKECDARTDIYALGLILYEMATGKRFTEDAAKQDIPERFAHAIELCLERNPEERWQSASDVRKELVWSGKPAVAAPLARTSSRFWMWLTAATLGAVVLGGAIARLPYLRTDPNGQPEMRLQVVANGLIPSMFAISPDGRALVYQASVDGQNWLWLREFGSENAKLLQGTERGSAPFWSPDGKSIGFFADRTLKRIDVASGIVQPLTSSQNANGSWGDGTIVFNRCGSCPLDQVRASGGEVVQATRIQPGQTTHRFPSFLPDRRHFLYLMLGASKQGIYVGALDSTDTQHLFEAESAPVFAPPDYVLFGRRGGLWAQRLDLNELKPIGEPIAVAERVAMDGAGFFHLAVSASAAGSIAYQTRHAARQLLWMDRNGRQTAMVGRPDDTQPFSTQGAVRLLPDDRSALVNRMVDGSRNVWLVDSENGAMRRITSESSREVLGVSSPDGSRLFFASVVSGVAQLFEKSFAGGPATLLLKSSELTVAHDLSADGSHLLYGAQTRSFDILVLPLTGDVKPIPVAQTDFYESDGRFSPNGQWIAYVSEESGRPEVYVQAFPGPGNRVVISAEGGSLPEWRADGRELFYMSLDSQLMAVPVTFNGSRIEHGKAVALFPVRPGSTYAPARDGQRFLINALVEDSSPITVLLNWKPGGK